MIAIVRPAGDPSIRWPLVDRSSDAVNTDAAVERYCCRTQPATNVVGLMPARDRKQVSIHACPRTSYSPEAGAGCLHGPC